jgi:hypothetical protein
MKIAIDIDDFSVLNNRFDLFMRLKEHYPKLKLSMFTIPFDYQHELGQGKLLRDKYLKVLKDNLDWIQLIPHGLSHMPHEFENADKETTRVALQAIDEAFEKDGLPYEQGFKSPYWLWNKDVVGVLDKHGWWGAIDRDQPDMLSTKRFYQYTHSIDEHFWTSNLPVWKLHGHMSQPDHNNIDDCFLNLMRMPHDAEFVFASELVEEYEGQSLSE